MIIGGNHYPTFFSFTKLFFTAVGLLILIDLPWLAFTKFYIKDPFYTEAIGGRLWAALPVYLALAYLVLLAKTPFDAFAIGMATYAVYDFTLLALFGQFRISSAIADSVWGGLLLLFTHLVLSKV
jgi:uncharacterized membrane protein